MSTFNENTFKQSELYKTIGSVDYIHSSLWKSAFGNDSEECKRLVDEYCRIRDKVQCLLAKIRNDFPQLTIHDISHADKLWVLASMIAGDGYAINQYEGFVLGVSFLLHDAALSFDSFGGQKKLRETSEWKDYVRKLQTEGIHDIGQIENEADFFAIRRLHAKMAEHLPTNSYIAEDGDVKYLIEDDNLRLRLGPLIGQVASSHHWDIDAVHSLDDQYNYPGGGITINAQKMSCLLRCADAAHIDDSRAPDTLLKSLILNRVSISHWCAQNRLATISYN